ncbi:glycoside-pentoside-hexuronide (GPH):cation symporter [Oenococcus alcoholitolerans]|uniref:glycoside-pentoside-hexuronide (GPH):cation symporter n=1 Tax=Oenococcus alcoholitolerans TaxID=931074 RepID=UPI003F716C88
MEQTWQTGWTERISYGLSDAADNLIFQMMSSYLLFFYTDIFGLPASQTAILFLVARSADLVESIIVGLIIDRTRSRYGKSRPFFLWYALPYVIFAVLTFVTPPFSANGKLAWAYITYLGLGFFYTAVNLPITSILPTLSNNEQELTLLGVIRQFFGSSVQIVVAVFTIPLVAFFGHGNRQAGFLLTIIFFSIISFLLIINTFFHVHERFTYPAISQQSLKKVWRMLKNNRPWFVISSVIFLYWLVMSIKNQTTIYYFRYVLNRQGLLPWANSFTFAALIGVVLIVKLSALYGKKRAMLTGMIIAFFGQIIMAFAVYTNNLLLLFTGIFINSTGNGMVVGLVSIMIADTIRYGISLGVQAEGLLASTDDFGVNMGLGLGGMITAGLLQFSGYTPNQVQSPLTISIIDLNYIWIPLIIYILMFVVLLFYDEGKMLKKIAQ